MRYGHRIPGRWRDRIEGVLVFGALVWLVLSPWWLTGLWQ